MDLAEDYFDDYIDITSSTSHRKNLSIDHYFPSPSQIRNPSSSFKYATVEKSSVETYFKRQVELSSMYLFMKDKNYKNAQEAIDALKRE